MIQEEKKKNLAVYSTHKIKKNCEDNFRTFCTGLERDRRGAKK